MTPQGLSVIGDELPLQAVYMSFKQDADFASAVSALEQRVADQAFAVVTRDQATSVRNVARLNDLPPLLAGLVGIVGAAMLGHALVSTIRGRRRDLAVLKTLGFVGRQIRATVAWEATALVVIALGIGIPAGIAAGRWGWRAFAKSLGVIPLPVVSTLLVPIAVIAVLAVSNSIAALPARAAARTSPAVVLRSE